MGLVICGMIARREKFLIDRAAIRQKPANKASGEMNMSLDTSGKAELTHRVGEIRLLLIKNKVTYLLKTHNSTNGSGQRHAKRVSPAE